MNQPYQGVDTAKHKRRVLSPNCSAVDCRYQCGSQVVERRLKHLPPIFGQWQRLLLRDELHIFFVRNGVEAHISREQRSVLEEHDGPDYQNPGQEVIAW